MSTSDARGDVGLSPPTPAVISSLKMSDSRLLADIKINGARVDATVDTGASRSYVNWELAKIIRTVENVKKVENQIRLANGVTMIVKETVWAEVQFAGNKCYLELGIMPDMRDEVLLGLDFLGKMKAEMMCGGQTVRLEMLAQPINTLVIEQEGTGRSTASKEEEMIKEFLRVELEKFEDVVGPTTLTEHKIYLKDDRPVRQRYTQRNPQMQRLIYEEVDELLKKGYIEPSNSPYSAPIVMAPKKNGKLRLCVDYRLLNAKTIADAYPLPRINTILDRLRNTRYISSIDLENGYWQVPMASDSKQYTAFTVSGKGLFQWKVMPFGLTSAPATFQRTLDRVIGAEMEPHAFAYLDDIVVLGKTLEDHMQNLKEVFRRLRAANLKINENKCSFFKSEIRYLGHLVTRDGIHTDPEKVAAIRNMQPPTNVREVRRCLGMASWYRRFVPDFAQIVLPLTTLLKKGKHFRWNAEQQAAFDSLKEKLTVAPVLACPDFSKEFVLQTDASNYGLGAVLTQQIDGQERVVSYASRRLNGAEMNYSATEKECLAIVWAVRKLRPYLEGYHFTIVTDHLALKWLNSIESPSGRIARWALELQQYDFDVRYRKGKLNVVADVLSRNPVGDCLRVEGARQGNDWWRNRKEEVERTPEKFPDYLINEGNMYRHILNTEDDEECSQWKLCVPAQQKHRVLIENHDSPTAGHLGMRKTISRISNRYYWPGMLRDIKNYVRQCQVCQKYKPEQKPPAGHMLTRIADEPWSIVCADFVGPLPRSKHGNSMLLVFTDKFSKWSEFVPLRRATGETLKKAFRERILANFGAPRLFVTDNGSQFTSKVFQSYLKELGIEQQLTAPYTPQENPTERVNRTIKTMMAQYAGKNQKTWDELLPELQLAVNTAKSDSTNYSAAFIVQGREPRLPATLYDEVTSGTGTSNCCPQAKATMMCEIFSMVRENLRKAASTQARYYNLR